MTVRQLDIPMTTVSRLTVLNDGFPVKRLVFADSAPDLPEKRVNGPYRNVSEYLNIHYDLLSENFLAPIRNGLKEYKCRSSMDTDKVRVFRDIKFTHVVFKSVPEDYLPGNYLYLNCVLDFGDNDSELEKPTFGSLLVFSRGNFDSKDSFMGKVISDEKSGNNVIEVEVKMPESQPSSDLNNCHFTMIEGDAFYYMYYHVLMVLSSYNEESFPMKKYIVYGTRETQVSPPSYLTGNSVSKTFGSEFQGIEPQMWPLHISSDLDESQSSALRAALSQELAVIHGAPGTGKTYCGIKLVTILLDNIHAWNKDLSTPILVVCQSNQALDHFMENLLKYTDKIVRIGDMCQSKPLMPYALKELVFRRYAQTSKKSRHIKLLLDDIDSIRLEVEQYPQRLSNTNLANYKKKIENLEALQKNLNNFWDRLPNKNANSLQVLRSAYVVGLTSTGAAARREYLEELRSPIVIIEEAGEMPEAHVAVSMTEHCRHLILLGDLKQVKPTGNQSHQARDNLRTSLLERLVTNGVVRGCSLTTQYRMQPEIASLLRPHIYKDLRDAPVTLHRQNVRGILKNVFFLNHREQELPAGRDKGFWNPHEVSILIYLAYYLVAYQKYLPSEIAIITMYSGQKKKFIEARNQFPAILHDVEVASVDGYRGRENEIILLSLVRSNTAKNIGFVKEENRLCAALSRARSGLFIMGNMACLQTEHLWNQVKHCLEKADQIGTKLTLHCEEHQTCHEISKRQDYGFRFCPSCSYETTKIRDTSDEVSIDIPLDVYRCDESRPYRNYVDRSSSFDRNFYHADRNSGKCGVRILGLLLTTVSLAVFGFFFLFMFRANKK